MSPGELQKKNPKTLKSTNQGKAPHCCSHSTDRISQEVPPGSKDSWEYSLSVGQGHGTLGIVAARVVCSQTLMTPLLLKPSLFPTSLILRFVLNLPHSHAQVTTTPHSCKHTQALTLVFSPGHYSNSLCLTPTLVLYLYSDLYLDFPCGQRELCGRPLDHSYTS